MWADPGVRGPGGARIDVAVLGPMEIRIGGRPVELTPGRLRALLAVLAMSAGRSVTLESLSSALWGTDPPRNARRSVQTYVTRLRGVLGGGTIDTRPGGYLLQADPDRVDALRFLRLVDAAAHERDPARQRDLLGQATGLWRGAPFEGVPWLSEAETLRLEERYLQAVERRVDLDLAEGRQDGLVTELGDLTARFPLRESLWLRLLVALDRQGRPAEALARFEAVRSRLAEELGVDPGPQLQQVYAALLAGGHPAPADDTGPVRLTPAGPRQLPVDLDTFTGREDHLAELDALLPADPPADGEAPRGPAVITVHGPAGVGKTVLAIRWAHRVSDRFPDGQLYVNLRGYDSTGMAVEPGQALRGFLDALGVRQPQLPPDREAQAALYRSLLADARMLVVLDNARDAEQVRPLLPAGPHCAVVVTSRNQLAGLATAGARPVGLGLLGADDAEALLARRIGVDRVAAEPSAAAAVVRRCAGLPLALAIVAGRAATHPDFPLTALADELDERARGLDAFAGDDRATDIRAVFSCSYRTLRPDAARLLRLLGVHPGPDVTAPAAASLASVPAPAAGSLLAELARVHLLAEHVPGRFAVHDLVRAYAAELAHEQDGPAELDAAWQRVLDHYLHTGHAAGRVLDPYEESILLEPPRPGVVHRPPPDGREALAWFAAECPALLAVQARASETGHGRQALGLAAVMWGYFVRQGRWHDLAAVERAALLAAPEVPGHPSRGPVLRALGRVYGELRRFADADRELGRALRESADVGDVRGMAATHRQWTLLRQRQGAYGEALGHARLALEQSRRAGDEIGAAKALSQIGWCRVHLGDHAGGLEDCRAALEVQTRLGDLPGQGLTWRGLGYAHHRAHDDQQAVTCYRRGLEVHRLTGDRYARAETLAHLGDAHHARGETARAGEVWQEALAILGDLGHPDADAALSVERSG